MFYLSCCYSSPILRSFFPSALQPPSHLHPTPQNSWAWVVHTSSSAFTFPTFFLTYSPACFIPAIYASYSLYLFHVHPLLLRPLPADNPPCDLHFCDSVPILLLCSVRLCFCFLLAWGVDSCDFVVILLFVVLIIIFFLHKCLEHFL